jgi:hypothetical protein
MLLSRQLVSQVWWARRLGCSGERIRSLNAMMPGRTIGAAITRTSPSLVFTYSIDEQAHMPDLMGLFITWDINSSCASCHRHSTDACQAARHTSALFQEGHGEAVREHHTPVTPSSRSATKGCCCQGRNLMLSCYSANRQGKVGAVL